MQYNVSLTRGIIIVKVAKITFKSKKRLVDSRTTFAIKLTYFCPFFLRPLYLCQLTSINWRIRVSDCLSVSFSHVRSQLTSNWPRRERRRSIGLPSVVSSEDSNHEQTDGYGGRRLASGGIHLGKSKSCVLTTVGPMLLVPAGLLKVGKWIDSSMLNLLVHLNI